MTDPHELRDDDLILMRNTETGGWFDCPAAAVDAWRARGWEVADPDERPAEANPVTEERTAALQDEPAAGEAPAAESEGDQPPAPPTRRTRRAASASQED